MRSLAAGLCFCVLIMAGCLQPAAPPSSTDDSQRRTSHERGAEPVPAVQALDIAGRTGLRACVGITFCDNHVIMSSKDSIRVFNGSDKIVQRIELQLTWTATSPITNQLMVEVRTVESCGGSCVRSTGDPSRFRGESPLQISWTGGGHMARLQVSALEDRSSPPLFAKGEIDQEFRLRGTIHYGPTTAD